MAFINIKSKKKDHLNISDRVLGWSSFLDSTSDDIEFYQFELL